VTLQTVLRMRSGAFVAPLLHQGITQLRSRSASGFYPGGEGEPSPWVNKLTDWKSVELMDLRTVAWATVRGAKPAAGKAAGHCRAASGALT